MDATQTVGQRVVNVQKIKCDALCATGRKFLRGPRGTGILYVRNSAMKFVLGEPSVIDHFGVQWVSYTISVVVEKMEDDAFLEIYEVKVVADEFR